MSFIVLSGAWCEPSCQSTGLFFHRYLGQWSHTWVWPWGGSTEVNNHLKGAASNILTLIPHLSRIR